MKQFLERMKEKIGSPKKKWAGYIMPVFAIGVALIATSGALFPKGIITGTGKGTGTQPQAAQATASAPAAASTVSYERALESRLEAVFASVEGAGAVSVMLTLSYGREIVVAQDNVSRESGTKEVDAQGGTREQFDRNSQGTQIIITGKDGTSQPLIVKEIEPQVEGVIIVAQGGDNVYVQDALIRATQTVLGVEPHKVQVLKMKGTKSANNVID